MMGMLQGLNVTMAADSAILDEDNTLRENILTVSQKWVRAFI